MTVSDNAIVLAGGRSSRFGSDKAFASYNGKPLIEGILQQLYSTFNRVILVTNNPEKYQSFQAELTSDIFNECGPLAGLHAGLSAAKGDYVYITACDMPFISLKLISRMRILLEVDKRDAVVVSRNGLIEPFNGFYARNLVPEIEKYLNQGKTAFYAFTRSLDLSIIDNSELFFQDKREGRDVFTNINSQEDLNRLIISEERREC